MKGNLKRFLSLWLMILLLLTTNNFRNASAIESDVFIMPSSGKPGQHNILFSESFLNLHSWLVNSTLISNTNVDPTCSSISDPKCMSAPLQFKAVIPFCDSVELLNCIDEVGVITPQGQRLVGQLKSRFPLKAQNEYKGSPENRLPSGTTSSVIEILEAPHAGGTEYIVTGYMGGQVDASTRVATLNDFIIRVTPIKIVPNVWSCEETATNKCVDSGIVNILGSDGVRRWGDQGPGVDGRQPCELISLRENKCARPFNFPRDFRYFVNIRTNLSLSGWLHGRVNDPAIVITKEQDSVKISMEAAPVWVPIIYKSNDWKDLPDYIKSEYDETTGYLKNGTNTGFSHIPDPNQNNPLTRNFTSQPYPSGEAGIRELQLWLKFLEDKATVIQSAWQVRSLSERELQGSNACFRSQNELTGIVSTNSTQYSAGPPSYNANTGSLDYIVASPHFDPFGDLFLGQYSLLMRSDVARCVYRFSNAPIKAELSVLSADGSPQIASLAISETNGWLRMNAFNFSYSAPTIKVVLKQEEVTPTPTLSPNSSPTSAAAPVLKKIIIKKNITCTKGKVTKKVTALSPKCPTGYVNKK